MTAIHVWLTEEALDAGEEAVEKCAELKFDNRQAALHIYMAMYRVQQMAEAKLGLVH